MLGVWLAHHLAEHGGAEGQPEVWPDLARTHRMGGVGHLEPAELRAVLVGPLSTRLVHVDRGVLERCSVVVREVDALLVGHLLNHWQLLMWVSVLDTRENAAHFNPATVLHALGEDVRDVEHEVAEVDLVEAEHALEVGEVVTTVVEGVVNESSDVLDDCDAIGAATGSSLVDVEIEVCEVADGDDHSRRGPGHSSLARVTCLEPSSQSAWVAASNNHPLARSPWVLLVEVSVLEVDEASQVSERLIGSQVLEIVR